MRRIGLRPGDAAISFLSILESRPASKVILRFLKAESLLACLKLVMLEFDAQSLAPAKALPGTVPPRMMLPPPSRFLSLIFCVLSSFAFARYSMRRSVGEHAFGLLCMSSLML